VVRVTLVKKEKTMRKIIIVQLILLLLACRNDAGIKNRNGMNSTTATAMMLANGQRSVPIYDATISSGFVNSLKQSSNSGGMMGIIDSPTSSLTFTAKNLSASIIPKVISNIQGYSVDYNGSTYYNPILKIQTGSNFQSTLVNQLNEETIIHWHGLILDSKNDGLPQQAVSTNGTYSYNFNIANRGGTYWYHPHPDGKTAKQAYMGLAGFYIIEDADSNNLNNSLDFNLGTTDIPLVIQDKRLDSSGNVLYSPTAMDSFMGYYGDNILVNLTPKPLMNLSNRIYRFRLLNGSNARTYRLSFIKNISDKINFNIIGTDGGLLDKPYQTTEVFLSPGERVDILLNLTSLSINDSFFLKSMNFDSMDNDMGAGMMSGGSMMGNGTMMQTSSLANGTEFYVMKFIVTERANYNKQIPSSLSSILPINTSNANTRKISISLSAMQWYINGKVYSMNEFPIEVARNSTEIWEISNPQASMPHPIHLHGFQFQILQRTNSPTQIKNLSTDTNNRLITDKGWKDTVLVWPGETVRIAINFSQNLTGVQDYIYHCHILEHEDKGMMMNYRVK
jgi:suppressor of ftsI/bilirubin oxidase